MVRLVASNIKQTLTRHPPQTSLEQKDHIEFSFEEVNSNVESHSASELIGILMRTSRRQ